jgi:hypothetical protein
MDALAGTIAGEPESGWEEEWSVLDGAVALGTRHVRRQCAVQAAAARSGKLPSGWYSLLPGSSPSERWTPAIRGAFDAIGKSWPDVKGWPHN